MNNLTQYTTGILILATAAFCFWLPPVAQSRVPDTIVLNVSTDFNAPFNEKVGAFIDGSSQLKVNQLKDAAFFPVEDFSFYSSGMTLSLWKRMVTPYESIRSTYWFRVYLKNEEPNDSLHLLLYTGMFDQIECYLDDQLYSEFGLVESYSNRPIPPDKYRTPLTLAPGKLTAVTIKINNLIRFETDSLDFQLSPAGPTATKGEDAYLFFYLYHGAFFGILFFLLIFFFLQFFQNRERAYLMYAAYLLGLFLYFIWKFEKSDMPLGLFYTYFGSWYYAVEVPFAVFIYLSYIYFIHYFLDIKALYPRLNSFAEKVALGIFIYLLIDRVLFHFVSVQASALTYYYIRILLLITGAYYLFQIFKIKGLLSTYVLLGTSCLLISAMITLSLSTLMESHYTGPWDIPLIPLQLGVIAELFFFSIGLGYKSKMLLHEKTISQRKHIEKLQENEKLKEQINLHLETKMLFLQDQLKHHFVLNCLNSIKNLIAKNQNEEAEEYLDHFSHLMKEILNASDIDEISLEHELENCRKYLFMEQLRFKQSFEFKISYDKNVAGSVFLPPFILQPSVENAIVHGLKAKPGKGRLSIRVVRKDKQLLCIIEDDGIGRLQAAEMQKGNILRRKRTGKGLELTRQRIEQYNETHLAQLQMRIIDPVDETGQALGTRVEFVFPLENG